MSLIDKMFSFRFQITFIVSNNHFNNLNDAKHRTYKKQKKNYTVLKLVLQFDFYWFMGWFYRQIPVQEKSSCSK